MNRRIAIALLLLVPLSAGMPPPHESFRAEQGRLLADRLGNFYLFAGNTLRSYDPEGKSTFSWSVPHGDIISKVDVSNPFKILVYSEASNTITFLDNKLTPIDDGIPLSSIGLPGSLSACTSFDNGFWVLDSWDVTLYRFNSFLDITNSTTIDDLLDEEVMLSEDEHMLYLYQPGAGLKVFDRYGTQVRQLPVRGLSLPGIRNGIFFGITGTALVLTDLGTLRTDTIGIREKDVGGLCLVDGGYALASADSVHIFQYRGP